MAQIVKPAFLCRSGGKTHVSCLDVQPGSLRFAVGDSVGEVQVWAVAPLLDAAVEASRDSLRVPLFAKAQHSNAVSALRWCRDGSRFATASTDMTACIWALQLGASGHGGAGGASAAFGASTSAASEVWLVAAVIRDGPLDVRDLCWSPDGRFLATGNNDMRVRVWDAHAATHQLRRAERRYFDAAERAAAAAGSHEARGGRQRRRGARESSADRGRSQRGRIVSEEEAGAGAGRITDAAEGSRAEGGLRAGDVASSSAASRPAVVMAAPPPEMVTAPAALLRGHSSGAQGLAWDPFGLFLASEGEDKRVLLWQPPQGALQRVLAQQARGACSDPVVVETLEGQARRKRRHLAAAAGEHDDSDGCEESEGEEGQGSGRTRGSGRHSAVKRAHRARDAAGGVEDGGYGSEGSSEGGSSSEAEGGARGKRRLSSGGGADRERKSRTHSRRRSRSRSRSAAASPPRPLRPGEEEPDAQQWMAAAPGPPCPLPHRKPAASVSRPYAACPGTVPARRVDWSPDGSVLATSYSLLQSRGEAAAAAAAAAAASVASGAGDDDAASLASQRTHGTHTTAGTAGEAPGFATPLLSRATLRPIAYLQGHTAATVAVRFAPALLCRENEVDLGPAAAGAQGEGEGEAQGDPAAAAAGGSVAARGRAMSLDGDRDGSSPDAPAAPAPRLRRELQVYPLLAVGSKDGGVSVWAPSHVAEGGEDPLLALPGLFDGAVTDLAWGAALPQPHLTAQAAALQQQHQQQVSPASRGRRRHGAASLLPREQQSGISGHVPFLLAAGNDGAIALVLFHAGTRLYPSSISSAALSPASLSPAAASPAAAAAVACDGLGDRAVAPAGRYAPPSAALQHLCRLYGADPAAVLAYLGQPAAAGAWHDAFPHHAKQPRWGRGGVPALGAQPSYGTGEGAEAGEGCEKGAAGSAGSSGKALRVSAQHAVALSVPELARLCAWTLQGYGQGQQAVEAAAEAEAEGGSDKACEAAGSSNSSSASDAEEPCDGVSGNSSSGSDSEADQGGASRGALSRPPTRGPRSSPPLAPSTRHRYPWERRLRVTTPAALRLSAAGGAHASAALLPALPEGSALAGIASAGDLHEAAKAGRITLANLADAQALYAGLQAQAAPLAAASAAAVAELQRQQLQGRGRPSPSRSHGAGAGAVAGRGGPRRIAPVPEAQADSAAAARVGAVSAALPHPQARATLLSASAGPSAGAAAAATAAPSAAPPSAAPASAAPASAASSSAAAVSAPAAAAPARASAAAAVSQADILQHLAAGASALDLLLGPAPAPVLPRAAAVAAAALPAIEAPATQASTQLPAVASRLAVQSGSAPEASARPRLASTSSVGFGFGEGQGEGGEPLLLSLPFATTQPSSVTDALAARMGAGGHAAGAAGAAGGLHDSSLSSSAAALSSPLPSPSLGLPGAGFGDAAGGASPGGVAGGGGGASWVTDSPVFDCVPVSTRIVMRASDLNKPSLIAASGERAHAGAGAAAVAVAGASAEVGVRRLLPSASPAASFPDASPRSAQSTLAVQGPDAPTSGAQQQQGQQALKLQACSWLRLLHRIMLRPAARAMMPRLPAAPAPGQEQAPAVAAPWFGLGSDAAAAGHPSAAAWQWQLALLQQQQQVLAWSQRQQIPGAGWGAAAPPWGLPPSGFHPGLHPPAAAAAVAAGWAPGPDGASAGLLSGSKRSRHELQPQPTGVEAAAKRARMHLVSEPGAAGCSTLTGVPSGAAGEEEGQEPSLLGTFHGSGISGGVVSGRRRVSFQQPPLSADDLAVEGSSSRISDGADSSLRSARPSAASASAPGLQADLIAAAAGAVGALSPGGGDDPLALVQAVCAAMTATFAAILERRNSSAATGAAASARGGIGAVGLGVSGVPAEELDTQAVVAEAPQDEGL